jgi:hypothetical protein
MYWAFCASFVYHRLLQRDKPLILNIAISRPEVLQPPSMPSDPTLLSPKPLLPKFPLSSSKEFAASKKRQVSLRPVESFPSGMAL